MRKEKTLKKVKNHINVDIGLNVSLHLYIRMSETYTITKEQYDFLMKQNEKANKRKEKDKLRIEKRKTHLKKYHQSEKGKAAKLKAQQKWRAKKRAS